ncbi:hypothetical protein EON64_18530 [archaeon]|nr:MAG: hypothetical protein EON64_18530 [archaeon]
MILNVSIAKIHEKLTGARDQNLLGADNHHLLAEKQLLGYNRGQTTQKVSLSVNNSNTWHFNA